MSISSPSTFNDYDRLIQGFCQPLHQRAGLKEGPCAKIVALDQEHNAISDKMRSELETVKAAAPDLLKNLKTKMMAIAAIGLGIGIGGFFAVVVGGGVLGIALGIIGLLGGILAGVFIGLYSAPREAERKTNLDARAVVAMEADWIREKMKKLDEEIALNQPDQAQLIDLKKYFEQVLKQQEVLDDSNQNQGFFHSLNQAFVPDPNTYEGELLKAWNNKDAPPSKNDGTTEISIARE